MSCGYDPILHMYLSIWGSIAYLRKNSLFLWVWLRKGKGDLNNTRHKTVLSREDKGRSLVGSGSIPPEGNVIVQELSTVTLAGQILSCYIVGCSLYYTCLSASLVSIYLMPKVLSSVKGKCLQPCPQEVESLLPTPSPKQSHRKQEEIGNSVSRHQWRLSLGVERAEKGRNIKA